MKLDVDEKRDTIDEASEESFPASDAPAWIMPGNRMAPASSTIQKKESITMPVQTQQASSHRSEVRHGDHDRNTIARDALVAGLNQDLAGEYQAVLMYSNYAANYENAIYSPRAGSYRYPAPRRGSAVRTMRQR